MGRKIWFSAGRQGCGDSGLDCSDVEILLQEAKYSISGNQAANPDFFLKISRLPQNLQCGAVWMDTECSRNF